MKLKHILKTVLSRDELELLVQSYDIVGDIAIIIVPRQLQHREPVIGQAILSAHKNLKVVAKRAGFYEGVFRTIPLTIIAGEHRKHTLHKEFGVSLLVNPETVYFSVRSGNERKRVADLVGMDESVLVMFSGIAPFPLMVARYSKARNIIGIELNPEAHGYALKNLELNKAQTRVALQLGDVREILPDLDTSFDRIIMPLPGTAHNYLECALDVLKKDGVLHFYDFKTPKTCADTHRIIEDACRRRNRIVRSSTMTVCGHSSPTTYRICVDARID